ncbi:hypothetical protein EHQ58_10265 [Leptospira ognonensis]|uniref:Uncharacterized protein n=1 Tax=Leptospira ognonensis TaxID=2484945 RepID=A0A4R9JZA3_9LEPT|nr:hypothetical protein [Leptospira ognonensis]TGL58692.1 hypothetical protein EHQ58_10265 [Leptospira ognonensis]
MNFNFKEFDKRLKLKDEESSFKTTYLRMHYSEESSNEIKQVKCLSCSEYFPEDKLGTMKILPKQLKVNSYVLYIFVCVNCKVVDTFDNEDFILDILSLNTLNSRRKLDFEIGHIRDIRNTVLVDLRMRISEYITDGLSFFSVNEEKKYLYYFGELLIDFFSLLLDNDLIFKDRAVFYEKLIHVLTYVWKREDFLPEKNYAYRGLGDDIFLKIKFIIALEENRILSGEEINEIFSTLINKTENKKVKEVKVEDTLFFSMKESIKNRSLYMNDIVYSQLRKKFDFV